MPDYRVVVYEIQHERPNGAERERLVPVIREDILDKPDARVPDAHCALVKVAGRLDADDTEVAVLAASNGTAPGCDGL
jgi:hypothetical protein